MDKFLTEILANNKIDKITKKRSNYNCELEKIQNEYLIKFNELGKNIQDDKKLEEIQKQLDNELIKLNQKYMNNDIKKDLKSTKIKA